MTRLLTPRRRARTVPMLALVVAAAALLAWAPSSEAAPTTKPVITAVSPPTSAAKGATFTLTFQATAPAVAGETLILESPGALNLGYFKVAQAPLDAALRASFTLSSTTIGTAQYWGRIAATGTHAEGKSATVKVTITAPPPPGAPTCGDAAPVKDDGSPWQCTYDDEFDGPSLDRTYWVPQVSTTTGTNSMFACGADRPDTIAVKDGNLELSLVKLAQSVTCGQKSSMYAFGQVMHYQTFAQTYGKFEVKALIPEVRVPGVQQSFWLWPAANSYGAWPASGEIDFAEMYSSQPDLLKPFIHYLPGATASGTNMNVTHADCALQQGVWNTYGLEWKPGQLKILLNGSVCFIDDYSSVLASLQGKNSPFDKPFYLSLNQAMGTTGNVYDPAVVPPVVTTKIDYVRIWK